MHLHRVSKRLLPSVVVIFLGFAALAVAASPAIIGTIVNSSRATMSGVAVPGPGTLTTNSLLSTAKGGSAWVKFSADTQAGLSGETSVRFDATGGRVSAQLTSGTMAAKSSGKDALIVETPKFRIEPAEGKTVYVVAMLQNNTTIVSARQGNVAVTETSSGKKHLVPEGHYAKISDAPAGTPGQAGAAAAGAGGASSGILSSVPFLFVVAVGAGVGIGFGVAEGPLGLGPASPSAP